MINIGVKHLLPPNWKAMAWIDADLEFESATWASDALKVLNGAADVIQLFSHCVDMDKSRRPMSVFNSFCYNVTKGLGYCNNGLSYSHPGYAWAVTKKAYNKMGGLFDGAIHGSGDHIMALCFIGLGLSSVNEGNHKSYIGAVLEYQERVRSLRLGYVPGVILHHYHGTKENRRYTDRWKLLIKYQFDPAVHLSKNVDGVLIPTYSFPQGLLNELKQYFFDRLEDA